MGDNTAYKFGETEQSEKFFENRIDGKSPAPVIEKEWLTTEEAAHFLGVSPASLRNLCSNGKVPYYKWQRRNRFKTIELRNLLLATRRGGLYEC